MPDRSSIRNILLLALGIFIAVHETLYEAAPREALLVLAAALMGLPMVLKNGGGGNKRNGNGAAK